MSWRLDFSSPLRRRRQSLIARRVAPPTNIWPATHAKQIQKIQPVVLSKAWSATNASASPSMTMVGSPPSIWIVTHAKASQNTASVSPSAALTAIAVSESPLSVKCSGNKARYSAMRLMAWRTSSHNSVRATDGVLFARLNRDMVSSANTFPGIRSPRNAVAGG